MPAPTVEDLLRREAPQVLAALVRRYGNFPLAEEAVQDALLEAYRSWSTEDLPANPRGWLVRIAQRSLIDALRSEYSRTARQQRYVNDAHELVAGPADATATDHDDSLQLLFLCCHPSLTPASAVALTLRALGGLTTDEIAAAFFVPSTTMGQRISRAKATLAGVTIDLETDRADFAARLDAVLAVLYLIFNEGYTSSAGDSVIRVDLSGEAIRLTRLLHAALPEQAGATGLLALQLLHESRRSTRESDGEPVPLDQQDRSGWDRELIAEGVLLAEEAMRRGPPSRYAVQAAIAALHAEAAAAADTDWLQILALYDLLARLDPSPMVLVSRAVAVARVHGPQAGLQALTAVDGGPELARSHRVEAVRAHLLEGTSDLASATQAYRKAAGLTRSLPERRYLLRRAERLGGSMGGTA